MADLWPDILHEASLGGITFPVARRRLRGGRAFASRQYPYRDGQTVEDTGREPYAFSLDVPLFASVDPSHYPDTADALRLLLEDGEDLGEVEYVDPFLGPLRVKLAGYDEDMDAQRRDGVTVRLDLEEIDPVEGGLFRVLANPDAESEARSAAADADDALSGAGLSEEDVSAILDAAGVPREAGAADAAASEGGAVGGLTS
ncbi:MAG: DNA circularization N-terminal domain-containing protein, partial [Sandaracinaceae bacterium]